MTNDKNLANELLKQNGLDPQKISIQSAQRTREMLAKELRRARRLKTASKILWLIMLAWVAMFYVVVVLFSWLFSRNPSSLQVGIFVLGTYVLGLCAIVCTVIAYIASRNATLKQIQASLADIAEELKHQSRDS